MNEMIKQGFAKRVADMIGDQNNGRVTTTVGRVENYYYDNNTLDLITTVSGAAAIHRSVPILMNNPNAKSYYHKGDSVVVLFLFDDSDMPVALGKVDEQYLTNSKQKLKSSFINLP